MFHALILAAQELDEWFAEHAGIFADLATDEGALLAITKLRTALRPLELLQSGSWSTRTTSTAKQGSDPLLQIVQRGHLEAVVFALRLYMEQDECVCEQESCPPRCEGCMYCIAHSALVVIGSIEPEDTDTEGTEHMPNK
jgi:hypothetical protein